MKRQNFTETQIISILKENEAGKSPKEICRNHGISDTTFYNWKTKYVGMAEREVKKIREMETRLSQLKGMFADIAIENRALRDFIGNKLEGCNNHEIYAFSNIREQQ